MLGEKLGEPREETSWDIIIRYQLMEELGPDNHWSFYNFLRITPAVFDELRQHITPFITKEDTNYRKTIEPVMKLAITLRHLAT